MTARYDIKLEGANWTVYDTITGLAAEVNDVVQVDLSLEDADDLADLLNRLHAEQRLRHRTECVESIAIGTCLSLRESRAFRRSYAPSLIAF
jgi:hypothetical protein